MNIKEAKKFEEAYLKIKRMAIRDGRLDFIKNDLYCIVDTLINTERVEGTAPEMHDLLNIPMQLSDIINEGENIIFVLKTPSNVGYWYNYRDVKPIGSAQQLFSNEFSHISKYSKKISKFDCKNIYQFKNVLI